MPPFYIMIHNAMIYLQICFINRHYSLKFGFFYKYLHMQILKCGFLKTLVRRLNDPLDSMQELKRLQKQENYCH